MFAIHAAHPIVHHPHASRPDSDAREHVAYLCLHLERSAPMVFHARKLSLHHNPCKSPSRHAVDIRAAQIQLSGSQCPEFRIMVAPLLPNMSCVCHKPSDLSFNESGVAAMAPCGLFLSPSSFSLSSILRQAVVPQSSVAPGQHTCPPVDHTSG